VHAIAAVDSEACLVDVEIAWRLEDARALAPRNRSALLDMGSLSPPSTQGCAPLRRSAIAFSARRALAAGIRRSIRWKCSPTPCGRYRRRTSP
jgi:hypothetical protein